MVHTCYPSTQKAASRRSVWLGQHTDTVSIKTKLNKIKQSLKMESNQEKLDSINEVMELVPV